MVVVVLVVLVPASKTPPSGRGGVLPNTDTLKSPSKGQMPVPVPETSPSMVVPWTTPLKVYDAEYPGPRSSMVKSAQLPFTRPLKVKVPSLTGTGAASSRSLPSAL